MLGVLRVLASSRLAAAVASCQLQMAGGGCRIICTCEPLGRSTHPLLSYNHLMRAGWGGGEGAECVLL